MVVNKNTTKPQISSNIFYCAVTVAQGLQQCQGHSEIGVHAYSSKGHTKRVLLSNLNYFDALI